MYGMAFLQYIKNGSVNPMFFRGGVILRNTGKEFWRYSFPVPGKRFLYV